MSSIPFKTDYSQSETTSKTTTPNIHTNNTTPNTTENHINYNILKNDNKNSSEKDYLNINLNNLQQLQKKHTNASPRNNRDSQITNNLNINNKKVKLNINIIDDADKLRQRREERKLRKEEKKNKLEEETNSKCDLEYEKLIRKKKIGFSSNVFAHQTLLNEKIFVIVRKRPIFSKEVANGEIDCLSALNPSLFIHEPKMKIDGITRYIEDHEFLFDNVFGDHEKTEQVYQFSIEPTIDFIFSRGIITCFAYGQTGSGKTYTMKGIQQNAIKSLFSSNNDKKFDIFVSFFEIYSEKLYDLLNERNKLQVLEDKNQVVQIHGLEEKIVSSPEEMEDLILKANNERTTHNTVTNETSSRSHAICNIIIKEKQSDEVYGKLTLVDLAGSEKAQETKSNIKSRMIEGAEINKSLLALKECIRALESRKSGNESHVPFRSNKLTLVLRDSFIPKNPEKAKIIMIACVSPCYSSSAHTLNTLRYSDRLKEKTKKKYGNQLNKFIPSSISTNNNNVKESNNFVNLNDKKVKINDDNKMLKDDMLINIKGEDIEFDEKDMFLKDNIDYYDDFLVEDKIQDLNIGKDNRNNGNKVRPTKPSAKTSFKPREKKIINNNSNNNINSNNISNNSNVNNNNINVHTNKDYKDNIGSNYGNKMNFGNNILSNNSNNNNNNNRENNSLNRDNNKEDLRKSITNKKNNFSEQDNKLSRSNQANAKLNPKIVKGEANLVSVHMSIIKEDATLLTEEGELVSNVKGVGDIDYEMESYSKDLERIINRKIKMYKDLKTKLDIYKYNNLKYKKD